MTCGLGFPAGLCAEDPLASRTLYVGKVKAGSNPTVSAARLSAMRRSQVRVKATPSPIALSQTCGRYSPHALAELADCCRVDGRRGLGDFPGDPTVTAPVVLLGRARSCGRSAGYGGLRALAADARRAQLRAQRLMSSGNLEDTGILGRTAVGCASTSADP